jgi:large subunit ribosomal protein L31
MKETIHPKYVESIVSCACGYTFKTHSTKPLIKLEICSNCHPFFTGKQKFIDTAGRVEKFQKRLEKIKKVQTKKKIEKKVVNTKKTAKKIFTALPKKSKTSSKKTHNKENKAE